MNKKHNAEIGLIRDMVRQAKDAALGAKGAFALNEFLFEMDEFEMREFLWLYRKSLQECCCVAELSDPECPQHGVHSKQAAIFYSQATPTRADQLECVHGDPCAEDHTCRNHRILAEVEDAFRALCARGWIPPIEK